jgi:hypothetical protein
MTARTGDFVTVPNLSFAPFSRAAFSSLVTIPNLNFAQFSRAAFASLVTIPNLNYAPFFRAGFSSLANINALAFYPATQSRYGAWTESFVSGSNFIYRMRAFNTTLGVFVYWNSPTIDVSGSYYPGTGTLINIVVSNIIC